MKRVFVALMAAVLVFGVAGGAALADELNAYRKANGKPALTLNKKLSKAAERHAQDMAKKDFRSHTGSDGSSVGQRVRKAGYKWCHVSENITWGRGSLRDAIAAWDASAGHKTNMLRRKPREYGVAGVDGIWVMVFARRC
jgi:uncharacterized protein YkwD